MSEPGAAAVEARVAMLVRRPVEDVWEAFVDPVVTSRFWFSKGSGRLDANERVRWDWEMYGFSVDVTVLAIERNRRILVEWPADATPTTIEWIFSARPDGTTYVRITNAGFAGSAEERARAALDATEGFAFVLAGAKAFLEHGIELGLVGDKFPDGLPSG